MVHKMLTILPLAIFLAVVINRPGEVSAEVPTPSPAKTHPTSPASPNQVSGTYFGWSSWSLQAFKGKVRLV
jgi:hypothetical protein